MAQTTTASAARAQQYLTAAAAAMATWYDAEGRWTAPTCPAANRERLWGSFCLYASDRATLADAVIRAGDTEQYGAVKFNIFDTNIAAALLVQHRQRMAADVRAKLERLVRDGFSFKPGNRQPDYQFHGYNDNMPAKATMGLILGGELLGNADAVAYGVWNLRQLRAMLVRQGINSEYNSPTYSPLTIHAMGEIAEHARDAEARDLAAGIEARLWLDLAARFHPETGILAGPHSRAYTADTLGHVSCAASLLWFVLGDVVKASPLLFFQPRPDLVAHHMNDYPFNIVQMCWFASGSYHLPPAAVRLFAGKPYPFRAVATAEHGDAGPDFPARPVRLESYLQRDYTVATASTPFCGGEQTMSYFCTYRRRAPVEVFGDVGTVFNKLVLDDEVPGEVLAPDATSANRGESDHCHSYSNTLAVQHDNTALVLTQPHLALGGPADAVAGPAQGAKPTGKALRRLSELVIFPCHGGELDELIVGGQPRPAWSGTVAHGEWIACRRGRLLIAIRPMAYSRLFGHAPITLERANRYDVIRCTLYQGAPRTFTRPELRHMFSGFVAEHASVDEYPSLAAFAAAVAQARFTDYYWTTRRTRYRRPATAQRPALEFETSASPGSHFPRIVAINGHAVAWPRVAVDTLTDADFPFLAEPFTSVPSFFPWQDFKVEWGEWPYAIGDREA
jgi:hypothetical protein